VSQVDKLLKLVHYFNFLGSALSLEDAKLFIRDLKIENVINNKIIIKEGFLTINEIYALERNMKITIRDYIQFQLF